MSSVERRLAAIMFTDIVGYGSLTQRDEGLALLLLEEHRGLLRPIFRSCGGTEVKTLGDGFLVSFPTASTAVTCGMQAQRALAERNGRVPAERRLFVRIGIHLGEVEERGGDILGDGVNIAARVEPLAEPGGICVTEDVARQIRNRAEVPLQSIGRRQLKHVMERVEVFRVCLEGAAPPAAPPEGESIAVLPFVNMSADPENEYFSDGMTEELLDAFAKVRGLKVIARTSVFALKGERLDVRTIGERLGVRKVLEGSVRRSGTRLRITAQLIAVEDQTHLWSERYDRDLGDLFAIQEDIAQAIVRTLVPRLVPPGGPCLTDHRAFGLEAYHAYLKGKYFLNRRAAKDLEAAIAAFEQATAAAPTFAAAWAGLAQTLTLCAVFEYRPREEGIPRARAAATRALALDAGLAEAHIAMAQVLEWNDWDFAGAEAAYRRALELNPGSADAHHAYAMLLSNQGRADASIDEMRLSLSLDPLSVSAHRRLGMLLCRAGRNGEALAALTHAAGMDPAYPLTSYWLGVVHLMLGHAAEALAAFEREPEEVWVLVGRAIARAHLGDRAGALAARDALVDGYADTCAYQIANVHAQWGEPAEAFGWLERAFAHRDPGLAHLQGEPLFAPLRDEPRFADLLARIAAR
jgi:TolB-like protein/Tfp pilus assembly protein PilF